MAAGELAGVLPQQEILRLCGLPLEGQDEDTAEGGVISPCVRRNVRTAGYDLRLGREYYVGDRKDQSHELETSMLPEKGGAVVIAPNSVVVITVIETLDLSRQLIGRLSLKMDLLRLGLIMAAQSQIDAGYQGRIFALLYNLSNEQRTIQHAQSVVRLELERLPEPSERDYTGDYEGKTLAEILDAPLVSSLEVMHERVRDMEAKIRNTRIVGVLAAIGLIVSFVLFFLAEFNDLQSEVSELRGQVEAESQSSGEAAARVGLCQDETRVQRASAPIC